MSAVNMWRPPHQPFKYPGVHCSHSHSQTHQSPSKYWMPFHEVCIAFTPPARFISLPANIECLSLGIHGVKLCKNSCIPLNSKFLWNLCQIPVISCFNIHYEGCNAMYVKDVERSSKSSYTSLLITFLIFNWFSIQKKVLKSWDLGLSNHMIKCYLFWRCQRLFQPLTPPRCFDILRAFKPYHQMLCMSKHVGGVKGQNNLWHLQNR